HLEGGDGASGRDATVRAPDVGEPEVAVGTLGDGQRLGLAVAGDRPVLPPAGLRQPPDSTCALRLGEPDRTIRTDDDRIGGPARFGNRKLSKTCSVGVGPWRRHDDRTWDQEHAAAAAWGC